MGLLVDTAPDYTNTGKGFLARWSNAASYIPVIGGAIAGFLGLVDTAVESAQWLFRGKIGSAVTTAVAGTVSATVNGVGATFFWPNAASGIATGETLGTHARALTETAIGGLTGVLGMKPQVLSSYPAAIGSIGGGMAQSGPGKFASNVSGERGQNANEAYARYMSGEGGAHVNELQSAYHNR